MRLAYVCADRGVPVFGRKGGSIHVQEVVRSLVARGATVELFARRRGGDPPPALAAVKVHRLPRTPRGEAAVRERADLESNGAIRDALVTHGPFDIVYERHSLWSFAAMEYARETGAAGLLEVNAPLLAEQRRYRELVHGPAAEVAVARAFAAASALLAVSDGVAGYLREHPDATGRVHVVPNGVDPARFSPAPPPARPRRPGDFVVGFVGTLKPWHGVEGLVDAFASQFAGDPAAHLLVVGDGPQRPELEALAAARGVGAAAHFTGAVAPAEIPALLASMDVAVAPYPPLDGFYFSPLKIFEYMAAARPIVAAAIGQVSQLVADGRTGLLYPPGDIAALAGALAALRPDAGLRRRLGNAARDAAVRDHTWQAVAGRILDLARRCRRTVPAARPVH